MGLCSLWCPHHREEQHLLAGAGMSDGNWFNDPKLTPELKAVLIEVLAKKTKDLATLLADGAVNAIMEMFPADNIVIIQTARVFCNRAAMLIFAHPMNAVFHDSDEERYRQKVTEQAAQFEQHAIEFLANHVDNKEFDDDCRQKVGRIMRSHGHTPVEGEVEQIIEASRGVWLSKVMEKKGV
jgi:hypothetical protein